MLTRTLSSMMVALFALQASAQITTYQLSLKDSTQSILYTDIPNKIEIRNLPKDADVDLKDGYISSADNYFYVTPRKQGSDTLIVHDKKGKLLFSKPYIVRPYNGSYPHIGNIKYTLASKSEVLADPSIKFEKTDDLLKPVWRITSYTISTLFKDSISSRIVTGYDLTGVPFDKGILDTIAQMKETDGVFVENIQVVGPDEKKRYLIPANVRIAFEPDSKEQNNPGNANLRKDLRLIVNEIAARKEVSYSKEDGLLEKLQAIATDKELEDLCDNKNKIIKCYAFKALTEQKSSRVFSVVMKHLYDTAKILSLSGDVGLSLPINEYLLMNSLPNGRKTDQDKLTYKEQLTLDSILLCSDITKHFMTGDIMLREMPAEPAFYPIIKNKVQLNFSSIALPILARYQNKNDIDIIKTALERNASYSIEAVREFPDPAFYPFLIKQFDKQLAEWKPSDYNNYPSWDVLLQALAKYPTAETYKLFKSITDLSVDEVFNPIKKALLIATTKYPNPVFEPLKKHIGLASVFDFDIQWALNTEQW